MLLKAVSVALAIEFIVQFADAQTVCADAPRLFQTTCNQLVTWDANARMWIAQRNQIAANTVINAPGVPMQPNFSPALPQRFGTTQYACLDLGCLCSFMRGLTGPGGQCTLNSGYQLRPAIRKEYRMLTDEERNRLHNAFQRLKASGEYDALAVHHKRVATSSGAHSGPGFLPWHREYLKRYEIALRMIDPSVAMPYWDSVLDFYLPNPRDSILWTPMFLGEPDNFGRVTNGPFAFWRSLEGNPTILRNLGAEGRMMNESDVNNVMAQTEVQYILAYTAPQAGCPYPVNFGALEYGHASVHLFVGGDMKPPSTSANDPAFFMHHSFVDYIWEQWRQRRQSRWAREQAYSPDNQWCSNTQHFSNAQMIPFDVTNREGLSNAYTDNMYRYQPRPTCTHQNPSCGSQYIFCDTRFAYAKCVSKIKIGGLCMGFEGTQACYNGACIGGRCIYAPTPAPPTAQRPAQSPPTTAVAANQSLRRPRPLPAGPRPKPRVTAPTPTTFANQTINAARRAQNCFNDDPCCSLWSQRNECPVNRAYMSRYCKRSCGYCKSNDTRRTGCFDRHQSCQYYRSQGECTRRRQWMSENCRSSCGWCNITPAQLCLSVARFSRM